MNHSVLNFTVRCTGLREAIKDVEQLRDDAAAGKVDHDEALDRARAKVKALFERMILEQPA